ncbi:MAG: hypothetical protein MI923_12415 [Phycisphaerales bacterium]|nr:hypothetical protein [Phycisphaerales bacterium]
MSEAKTIDSRTVIIGKDESLLECGATLRSYGTVVHFVSDVYAAMVQLAGGPAARSVVVDIRLLDDHEMNFLSLAPRYYEKLQILVPLLEGTTERAAACEGCWKALSVSDLTDSLLGIRSAVTVDYQDGTEVIEWADESSEGLSEEGWNGTVPVSEADRGMVFGSAPSDSLSTGGGSDSGMDGPSLHEAVRRRMADSSASEASIRRKPPSSESTAFQPDSASSPKVSPDDETTLSAEEMDALLRDGDEGHGA